MCTAAAHNVTDLIAGKEPTHEGTWNAVCLADFGDNGIAFIAQPQIPPRNVNWSAKGYWVHLAKVAYEIYFLRKVRKGQAEPIYERLIMKWLGIVRLKENTRSGTLRGEVFRASLICSKGDQPGPAVRTPGEGTCGGWAWPRQDLCLACRTRGPKALGLALIRVQEPPCEVSRNH